MTTQTDDHVDPHHDKFNDPRVQISRNGILFAAVVVLFGICGAALSIWARRTRLEQTTQFWGPEVIEAFQLAQEVDLEPAGLSDQASDAPVRLTGMPGLGHLRHVLLDERSYSWESLQDRPIAAELSDRASMLLHFTDPEAHRFPDATVVIGLDQGWVGLVEGERCVQLNERFRNAMPTFLKRIANYEQLRADDRDEAPPEGS